MTRTFNKKFWNKKNVVVTGGAGFIGSHTAKQLIGLGANVTIGDNLSTGSLENVIGVWQSFGYKSEASPKGGNLSWNNQRFVTIDFHDYEATKIILKGIDIVIHLAATIGGRGYIDTHPADCCLNFSINDNVIRAAHMMCVDRIVYASTACVYPMELQEKYDSAYLLKEEDAFKNGWANCDVEYGWAKFMGEMQLKAYHKQYGLKSAIVRYLTAYGPGENDTHAIMALVRRALERQDPYVIWGTGEEDRGFTYVDDIVAGTLLAAENITDATPINVGVEERYKLKNVAQSIFNLIDFRPKKIIFDTSKPKGVTSRALAMDRARSLLKWYPEVSLEEGLQKTIDWYKKAKPQSVETLI